jgi:hypothetical protein
VSDRAPRWGSGSGWGKIGLLVWVRGIGTRVAVCVAVVAACSSDPDAADAPDKRGGSAGKPPGAGTAGSAAKAGRSGNAGTAGDTTTAGSTSGGRTSSGGMGSAGRSAAGRGGSAGGDPAGGTSNAGEAGRPAAEGGAAGEPMSNAGSGGTGATAPECDAGPASDHVADASTCAADDTCEPDALGRSFSPPIRIDDGTSCVEGPVLVRQPSADEGLVAFADASPGRVRVRRTGVDAAWSPFEQAGPNWGTDLAVAADTTNALLVGSRPGRVFANVSAGGAAWSGFHVLGSGFDASVETNVDVAVDSTGRALAVWNQNLTDLYWATWTSSGGWSTPALFATETTSASLAPIPGGGFAMARIRTGAVGLFIYSATTGWDAGDYVGSLHAVGDEQRSRAAVGVDALGYVHVVWTQPIENDEYYSEIFYDERDPSGVWATTRGFLENKVDGRHKPDLRVAPNGNVIVSWRRASTIYNHRAVLVRDDRSWAEVRELGGSSLDTHPAVAIDDAGNALIAWGMEEPDFGLVRANRYFVGSGWESSTYFVLYDDETASSAPHLGAALSPTGEGLIAYVVRKEGEPDRVYANTLR